MRQPEVFVPSSAPDLSEWLRSRTGEPSPAVTGTQEIGGIGSVPLDTDEADLAVVSTCRFSEVHSFRPRDLTIEVGAGMRMQDLAAIVDSEGLWIPAAGIGVARSVGGWIAAASPAAWDASYGPVRRQLLGCRVITPAGSELTWGRAVMKNVAGYDLPRLLAGSRGRLGVLTRVTLRLWPRPEAVTAWRVNGEISPTAVDSVRADAVTWSWRRTEQEQGTALLAGSASAVRRRHRSLAVRMRDAGHEIAEAEPRLESGSHLAGRLLGSAVYRLTPGRRYVPITFRELASSGHPRLAAIEAIPESGTMLVFLDPDPAGTDRAHEFLALCVSSVDRATSGTERAAEFGVERAGRAGHDEVDALRASGTRTIERRLERALGAWSRTWQADYL